MQLSTTHLFEIDSNSVDIETSFRSDLAPEEGKVRENSLN